MPRTVIQRVLVPAHPVRAGGLSCLSLAAMLFAPLMAAHGAPLAWLPLDGVAGWAIEAAATGGILSEDSLIPHRATSGGSIDQENSQ